MSLKQELANLDFVHVEPGNTCYWTPEDSGDWAQDTGRGRELASSYIVFAARTGASILPFIVQAMAERGQTGSGVATGFLSFIEKAAEFG